MGLFGSSKKRSHDAAAVITGAGSGIGAAFAVELAKRGGRVVCSDIDEVSASATADAIIADGGEATSLRCDVSEVDDVTVLATEAQSWFGGPPTVVINNAGVGAGGLPIGEMSLDDWQWVLDINLWGPIHGCHVFAPDPARGRVWRNHQRRIGRGVRRGAGHGRLQRQQGGHAVPVRDAGRRTVRNRRQRHRAVPDLRQDQYRRCGPDLRTVNATGRSADALDRLLSRTGGPHLPGHPRPRRPLLHAATRRPDRLGHQAFHPDGVHPRRRPHHPRDDHARRI